MLPTRTSRLLVLLFCLGLVLAASRSVGAQTEVGLIRGDPLTIQTYEDGSVQVWHKRYTQGASFGTAGSGFFVAVNGITYGPFFTQMEHVDQEAVKGQGTATNPFSSVAHFRIRNDGTLDVTQTVLYVNGASSFQQQWQVVNTGSANVCVTAYHAADLYFAEDDDGIGYYDARTGSVGGYNQGKDWFMVFTPLNPASHYEESDYSTIWERVRNHESLTDTVSSEYIDNGAALQWDFCLAGGQSKTISDVWSFGESESAIVAAAQQAAGAGGTDAYGGGTAGPLGNSAPRYRKVAPGSPALTTSIPTPLDISLAPEVAGINLLWAALATILFTIASELFNRTLAHHEAFFQRLFKPLRSLSTWRKKTGLNLGRHTWFEWLKLVIIVLLYGLIFSALDKTWEPVSFNGVWLFISMALAFGVVGLADDIVQWNTARHWKLPTRIEIKPGNLLLAVLSSLFSRTLALIPGVMFGTPEAFEIEASVLDEKRTNRLLLIAGGVLLAILALSWLPTALCALALNAIATLPANVQPFLLIPVAALQSLLLLIFAVTVQNLFLHMLAMPNTIGEMIKRKNRIIWFIALFLASFLYLHFLLNPVGDLARSLQASNVRVFVATIGLFLLFTLIMRALLKRFQSVNSGGTGPMPVPASQQNAALAVIGSSQPLSATPPGVSQAPAAAEAGQAPVLSATPPVTPP